MSGTQEEQDNAHGQEGSYGNLPDGLGDDASEQAKRDRIRLRNRDAQRRLRARKRAAAQEAAKTLEEVDDAIARAEDANDQLDVDNVVLEKVIAVREEFIRALQYLQQVDIVVRAGDAAAAEPLPPEVLELTRMAPADFATQWRRWHRALKTRYQVAEASAWSEEACEELAQHVAYLVAVFQAVTLTAPDNVLALYAATSEPSSTVAHSLPRWQLTAASLEASEAQLCELRGVYETYLRRMARLIANRNLAYAQVEQVSCPSPRRVLQGGSAAALSSTTPTPSPSLISLARSSSDLQRSVESVTTTYKTEYHVINDLVDSMFAILTPRQLARLVAQSDPLMPDYLQILCCLMNKAQQVEPRGVHDLGAGEVQGGSSQQELGGEPQHEDMEEEQHQQQEDVAPAEQVRPAGEAEVGQQEEGGGQQARGMEGVVSGEAPPNRGTPAQRH